MNEKQLIGNWLYGIVDGWNKLYYNANSLSLTPVQISVNILHMKRSFMPKLCSWWNLKKKKNKQKNVACFLYNLLSPLVPFQPYWLLIQGHFFFCFSN